MTHKNDRQIELYDRFKQYSGLKDWHIDLFRECIINYEHQHYRNSLDDFDDDDDDDDDDTDSGEFGWEPGKKWYKADGSELTLADVPLKSLVKQIEEHIQTHIAEPSRTELYKKTVEGVPGIKQTPRWDLVDSPRTKPQTPFSESRASLESYETNLKLFRKFKTVSKLSPDTLAHIQGMILWRDSERSNGTWGAINLDTFTVTGGRLGPTEEHALYDVPNCYLRDRLMASTFKEIDAKRRGAVRKALFPDLTTAEIAKYAAKIEELEQQAEQHKPAKKKKSQRPRKASDRALLVQEIQRSRKIAPQEAECIMKQEELLDAVDESINLAPNFSFAARKMKCPYPGTYFYKTYSVLKPKTLIEWSDEIRVPEDCHIDRDCDQIRAMIKILVREGGWTMEGFTLALDGPGRAQVNTFLEKNGPLQGKQSSVFWKSWDFFKRREMLGAELTARPPKRKLARELKGLWNM
ncbi:hypothetical protein F4777DRAFT_299587 [Nemania sp. FL0916]|nr:hypothetical protein F4777DRAFT_299587 [Nemania sp. FL0916]